MRQNNGFSLKKIYKNQLFWTFSGFIVLSLIMTIFTEQFLTYSNIINVVRQVSINGVIAVGMTFVILISGIDLSVGSVMAFSGTMMVAAMVNWGWPVTLAILFGLFIGFVFGLINGSLVAFLKLPAIIVTLAMMEVPRGLALLYTGGYPLSGVPDTFGFFGRGYVLNVIPTPVMILALMYFIGYIILTKIPIGRYIYALGGNEEAVKLSGINVKLYKIIPFVISGVTASVSGLILSSRLMSGQPMAGTGFELDAIAAVVLGGTDIAGGRGSIIGTLLGALLLGVLSNGLNLMGISPYAQRVVKGLIIIGAVYFSSYKQK